MTELLVAGAVLAVAITEQAPTDQAWLLGAVLAVAATGHAVLTRPVEERRRAARLRLGRVEHVDQTSIFVCAAALLVPMSLVLALVVLVKSLRYLIARRPAWRWMISTIGVVASALGVHLIVMLSPLGAWLAQPSGARFTTADGLALVGVIAVYFAAQALVIGGARWLEPGVHRPAELLGRRVDNMLIIYTLLLAVLTAVVTALALPLLVFMAAVAVHSTRDLHRRMLLATERAFQADRADRAERDHLTGLPTRHILMPQAEHIVATVPATALLILDIDKFKAWNDVYLGHAGADQLLRAVAALLPGCLRPGDLVGRYGGEEFVAVLPGAGAEDALAVAERIRAAVEALELTVTSPTGADPVTLGQAAADGTMVPRCTVTIGVAVAPLHGNARDELLHHADQALLAGKDAGRNRVQLAGPVRSAALPSA